MKKLVALLAVLTYVPFAHAAEGDWAHSGEFRLQYDGKDNATDFDKDTNDHNQTIHQRTKLGTTVRAGEKMTVNLGIVHNADWGSNATQVPSDIATTTSNPEGTKNLLIVNEANLVWQTSDVMTWKFGRMSHTIADGSVVSANTFENVQTAFDAAGLVYELEPVRLTAFGVMGAHDDDLTTRPNTFGRFYGISADFKTLPSWLKMANVHYMAIKRDAGTYGTAVVPGEDTSRIGVTVGGDVAGVDYKATYAMYSGDQITAGTTTTEDIDASMWDAEVGYSLPSLMNLHVWVGMHSDSGDKDAQAGNTDKKHKTYNPFYYDQHENAGLMDILGWGNLTYQRVGAKINPMEDVTVALEYLIFTKTEKGDFSFNKGGATAAANALTTDTTKDDLGSEIDLSVAKKYTNNFTTSLRYSMFQAGDAMKGVVVGSTKADDASEIYLESKLTF